MQGNAVREKVVLKSVENPLIIRSPNKHSLIILYTKARIITRFGKNGCYLS